MQDSTTDFQVKIQCIIQFYSFASHLQRILQIKKTQQNRYF